MVPQARVETGCELRGPAPDGGSVSLFPRARAAAGRLGRRSGPGTARGPAPAAARPSSPRNGVVDSPVRRVQAAPGEVQPAPFTPGVLRPGAGGALMGETVPTVGGQSISLQAALYGALTSNPDLATLRLGNPTTPSAEAVEVARNFPTTLNPTLWCDLRPITLIPPDPFGGIGPERNQTRLLPMRPVLLSTCRSASRSSWGTRRRTATTSPRRPTSSSNGPSSRPSCWPWCRPIASSRRRPIAASG